MGFVFEINGINFVPFLSENGLKWTRNDVDSPEAGQMMDGTLRRDRVIMRRRIEVTILGGLTKRGKLTEREMSILQRAIFPQWVSVRFNDPLEGSIITRTFYSNNITVTTSSYDRKRDILYYDGGWTFPLIEEGIPL